MKERENLIIQVFKNSESEFEFNIYDGDDACELADPIDGGICESTLKNAIDMACSQAKDLLTNNSLNK